MSDSRPMTRCLYDGCSNVVRFPRYLLRYAQGTTWRRWCDGCLMRMKGRTPRELRQWRVSVMLEKR